MTVEIVYTDGTVEHVDRALGVLYPNDPDDQKAKIAVHTKPGSPLRWIALNTIKTWHFLKQPELPEPWKPRPGGQRLAVPRAA